ncbi:MAG: hypothetical protein PF517_20110 [Salinivirgaceae bacterium]|jgi:hypothetical protein|nr:hypothetical protein [Salinivirgaceae bacterium]
MKGESPIVDYLIANFESTIGKYFPSENKEWKDNYNNRKIEHDEPWVTLIAMYSLFGNQENVTENQVDAFNQVLANAGFANAPKFSSIEKVIVEEKLAEIKSYRLFLLEEFKKDVFHLYPDRIKTIEEKIEKANASFEGNTNLDLKIIGQVNGKRTICFIEAKFLSDISYSTTYNPVRDQIIRNIDCGIDCLINKNSNHIDSIENFYFLMLTPKVFRTVKYGGGKTSGINQFGADSSRLYCYKMDEYKSWSKIKSRLPHRKELSDKNWETLSDNIGWITFEDIYTNGVSEDNMIEKFFKERNLI